MRNGGETDRAFTRTSADDRRDHSMSVKMLKIGR
jgi:hypothetical protein